MPDPSPNDKTLDPLSCPCNGDCHKDRIFAHGSCCQTINHLPMDPGIRDRIRQALCNINGKGYLWGTDMMEPDEYGEQADLILQQMSHNLLIPVVAENTCAHCGSMTHTRNDCDEYVVAVALDRAKQNQHSCDNCDGIDPDTCVMNSQNVDAHAEDENAFCGPDCYETNAKPHSHRWAQTVHSTNGTRTVHIPYLDANGHEAGTVEVHHTDVRTLALMLCDDPTRIADPSGEPETDEERVDRLEVESEHAAGIHTHCGVTCEEHFPSDMLRNAILVRAISGSATMLDELVRRAATQAKNCENCDRSKAVDRVAKYVADQQ